MTHVPHSLAEDFPEHLNTVMTLKSVDTHFARLAEAYHAINRKIHRVETRVEAVSDVVELEMRHKRAALKDEIWAMLQEAEGRLTT